MSAYKPWNQWCLIGLSHWSASMHSILRHSEDCKAYAERKIAVVSVCGPSSSGKSACAAPFGCFHRRSWSAVPFSSILNIEWFWKLKCLHVVCVCANFAFACDQSSLVHWCLIWIWRLLAESITGTCWTQFVHLQGQSVTTWYNMYDATVYHW